MKKGRLWSFIVLIVVLLAVVWASAVFSATNEQKQEKLIAEAKALLQEEIYLRAQPLLEEAVSYQTDRTYHAENLLKKVYLALREDQGYETKYRNLLTAQMERAGAPAEVFFEAADYYFDSEKIAKGIAALRDGVQATNDPALLEAYEANRYQYRPGRVSFQQIMEAYNGMRQVQSEEGLWGLADLSGKLSIPCLYEAVSTYSNQLAVVQSAEDGSIFSVDAANHRMYVLKTDIQSAFVDGGSEDIKDQLFGENGYTANYSGKGHTFEITDNDEQKHTIQVIITDTERKEYYDGDPYFQAKSTAVESGYVDNYVMSPQSDSLYSSSENCYQTILLLPGGDAVLDMSQLKPTFYTGTGVQAYAKSVGEAGAVKQISGQSVVDFTTSPVQYTAKDGADKSIKNYWVTYQAQQEAATLFVNGPSFDELQTEKVADKDKREVYLNTADDYHDIFFANLGKEELTGLSVSLDEDAQKTLKLDDFWTIEDGDALNDFDTCSSDIKSAAKIRLRLKDAPENLETTEISGVLTVVSNAGTKYIYLTGSILPEIVTESVPNGVKYVPYSVMVQTNNHDDASKVTFSVDAGSLPKGVSLNENTGEIYGVPTKTGTYKFSIKASFSAEGVADSVKEYTIEVAENTDQNVEQENEHPILNHVYDMGENGDIDDWKGKFHEQDFRVDHTYAEFVKFFIDGDLLKEGKDYESSEGSTKITIYRKTFERYGNGKHTIAAEFRNSDNTMTKSTQNYEANVKIKVNPGSSSAPIVSPNKPTTPATPSQSTGRFVDVNKPDWFYDNVMWAAEQGYMVGVSANRFAPKQNTTQAMVVTVLARIAKVDLTAYAGGAQANWYTSAANWAQSLGMISLDTFEPNAPIRRGDLAVMLLKYFDGIKVSYGVPKQQERVNFFDAAEMTAEEELAFQCCYKEKIFLGNGKNDMQPNGFTTRAQLAALIERIAGHVEANKA